MEEQIPKIPIQPKESIESEQPSTLPKKKFSLKIIVILLVVILFVAGLVYTGMQIGKKQFPIAQPTPTTVPTVIPTPDETANWKTYEDASLNFSIKLPIDLDLLKKNEEEVEFATVPPMTKASLVISRQLTDFSSIVICSEPSFETPCIVSDYWEKDKKGTNDTKLAGIDAKWFYIWREVGRQEEVIQTIRKPLVEVRFWRNHPTFSENESLSGQILSTFKFLD